VRQTEVADSCAIPVVTLHRRMLFLAEFRAFTGCDHRRNFEDGLFVAQITQTNSKSEVERRA